MEILSNVKIAQMTSESEPIVAQNEVVLKQLVDINSQLSRFYALKRKNYLGRAEKEQMALLNDRKNHLITQALIQRRDGDESIKVFILGRPQDNLHPYSRNRMDILFRHPVPPHKICRTAASLSSFRSYYQDGLPDLIGVPDGFKSEPIGDYVIRTVAEIAALGRDLDDASKRVYLAKKQELSKLKSILAARVIRVRIDNGLTRREIQIRLLRNPRGIKQLDLVEVKFYPGAGESQWSFHMPTSDPFFRLQVKPLIDQLGGYDRETIGR